MITKGSWMKRRPAPWKPGRRYSGKTFWRITPHLRVVHIGYAIDEHAYLLGKQVGWRRRVGEACINVVMSLFVVSTANMGI